MDSIIVRKERCKQCGLCITHCAKKAITFSEKFNDAGYSYVTVDESVCIKCGMCYIMCPDGVYEVTAEPKNTRRN